MFSNNLSNAFVVFILEMEVEVTIKQILEILHSAAFTYRMRWEKLNDTSDH